MNNLFIKNLTALSQRNQNLAQKLQTYIPTELPKLVQENNNYNILYKDKLVHNKLNPLGEANEIFSMAENNPVSIHIIYGLGLGYLFQLASIKSEGTVVLYEPDLNLLWFAFTLVDFSSNILKSNTFITSTFEELSEIIHQKSGMKNIPVLLSSTSQKEFNPQEFDTLVKKLQDMVGTFSLDLKYTQEKFYPSLKMLIQNIPNLLQETPLIKLKNIYQNKTAVVISAGPSLDKNIETLKKYRDRFILITVGTAVKTLYANDLTPDFICIIETYNSSRQIEDLDLNNVNFITEPYSNPALRNFKFKKVYSHISNNTPINHFWSEICEENIEEYYSKGTVSYTALNCARILGCSKIILVGQDLAYIEGQCYSKDSAYKNLSCQYNNTTNRWEINADNFEQFAKAISPSQDPLVREKVALNRLQNLNNSLYYVKGINGDMIPTESVYATFVKVLEDFTQIFNDRRYINTSLVGAQINGFENLSLEEALKDSDIINDIKLSTQFEYDKNKIINKLKTKLSELKTAIPIIEEGKKNSKNINNDLKRYRMINTNILKLLKKSSINYLNLTTDFINNSKLFEYIITADKIDLDYEMKMLKEFTFENVSNINSKLAVFYENTENKILEIERLINESIASAS